MVDVTVTGELSGSKNVVAGWEASRHDVIVGDEGVINRVVVGLREVVDRGVADREVEVRRTAAVALPANVIIAKILLALLMNPMSIVVVSAQFEIVMRTSCLYHGTVIYLFIHVGDIGSQIMTHSGFRNDIS